jgi:hypothetical protein
MIALVGGFCLCVEIAQAQVIAKEGSEEDKCYVNVSHLSKYQALQGGFRQKEGVPMFLKYANTNKATETEKQLLAGYAEDMQSCYEAGRRFRTENFEPAMRSIADDGFRTYLSLVARVYNQELTYGGYHRLRDQAESDIQSRLDRLQADEVRANANVAQQNAASEQARRNAVNNTIIGNAMQGARDAFRQPVRTDCYGIGAGMSCQTR